MLRGPVRRSPVLPPCSVILFQWRLPPTPRLAHALHTCRRSSGSSKPMLAVAIPTRTCIKCCRVLDRSPHAARRFRAHRNRRLRGPDQQRTAGRAVLARTGKRSGHRAIAALGTRTAHVLGVRDHAGLRLVQCRCSYRRIHARWSVVLDVVFGLAAGKPLGITAAAAGAVATNFADSRPMCGGRRSTDVRGLAASGSRCRYSSPTWRLKGRHSSTPRSWAFSRLGHRCRDWRNRNSC